MYLLIELIFGMECKDGEGEVMRNVSPLPPEGLRIGLFLCVPHGPCNSIFTKGECDQVYIFWFERQ